MQPTYLPWIGHFDLIDQVDKFVFLDNVQLVKRSWDVRNRIKTAQGELYLTVPIKKTKHRDELLQYDALVSDETPWREKHLKSIALAYKKAPFFEEVYTFLEKMISNQEKFLSKLNIKIIQNIAKKLGIETSLLKASALPNLTGKKDMLLASICKAIACDHYISQPGAAAYIESQSPGGSLVKNQIDLYYHNYHHPDYSQLYGTFLSNMSIVDLLFNQGFQKSLDIIQSGRKEPIDYCSFRYQLKIN